MLDADPGDAEEPELGLELAGGRDDRLRRVTGVDRAAEVQRAPCLVDADERSLSHGLQIAGEPIRDPLELDCGFDGPALDVDLVHGREPFLWRHSGSGDDDCSHLARENIAEAHIG